MKHVGTRTKKSLCEQFNADNFKYTAKGYKFANDHGFYRNKSKGLKQWPKLLMGKL